MNSPVGFDSKMYPRVLREVARVGEGLVALRAFVRLRLPHVDLRVHLQVRLRTEDLERKGDGSRIIYSVSRNFLYEYTHFTESNLAISPRHQRPSREKLLRGPD